MANEHNLRPRQPEYVQSFHDAAGYRLALLGFGIKQLASTLGHSQSTIYRWFKQYPSFQVAVNRGRLIADAEVAASLFRMATGYEVDEEQLFVVRVGRHEQQVVRQVVRKHYPPNTKACLFWLRNRQPHLWSDKQQALLTGTISLTMHLEGEPTSTDFLG